MQLRTDGVHYREPAGTKRVVLKLVQVTNGGCLFRYISTPWTNLRASLFLQSLLTNGTVDMSDYRKKYRRRDYSMID